MTQEKTDYIQKRSLERVLLPSEEAKAMNGEVSLSKFTKHESNPFVQNLAKEGFSYGIKHSRVLDNQVAYDVSTGTINGELALGVRKKVDRRQFVKLYGSTLKNLMQLSPSATRVFYSILWEVQHRKNEDKIDLNYKIVNHLIGQARAEAEERGESVPAHLKPLAKGSFYKALSELVSLNFLAPCSLSSSWFWINPQLFYNGDAISLVQSFDITDQNSTMRDITPSEQDDFGRLDSKDPFDDWTKA